MSDHWCDKAFGPFIKDAVEDMREYPDADPYGLAYRCRRDKGHDGPHDCVAASNAGYRDTTHRLRTPAAIERFLEET